jgi:hypothetical protein
MLTGQILDCTLGPTGEHWKTILVVYIQQYVSCERDAEVHRRMSALSANELMIVPPSCGELSDVGLAS